MKKLYFLLIILLPIACFASSQDEGFLIKQKITIDVEKEIKQHIETYRSLIDPNFVLPIEIQKLECLDKLIATLDLLIEQTEEEMSSK